MTGSPGFPTRTRFTAIPNSFFSTVLPQIDDLAELKVTLHIFWLLYQKKGYPRFVTYAELAADPVLGAGIGDGDRLEQAVEAAVRRGTLLRLALEHDGQVHHLYFVNTEADRRALARIESGEVQLGGLVREEPTEARAQRPPSTKPNIFTLYEQNIGLLSPLIAEELKEAERLYPQSWIEDAFTEAVSLNKRSWRYIQRILERWAREGKEHGEPGRYPKADVDRKEYLKRYGYLLRR